MITEYDPLELMAQVTAQSSNFQDKQFEIHLGVLEKYHSTATTMFYLL